jgi:hypothetical protein
LVYKGSVNVDFTEETAKALVNIPAVKLDDVTEASKLVDNALRVYLQLKKIAKGDSSITVVDSKNTRYTINLD